MSRGSFYRASRQMFQSVFREAKQSSPCSQSSASHAFSQAKQSARSFAFAGSTGNPILQGWRQEQAKFSGPPGGGSFAASGMHPPNNAPQAAPCNNTAARSVATNAVEETEGENSGSSGKSRLLAATKEGEDDDDTLSHERKTFRKRKRPDEYVRLTKQQRDVQEYERMDNADPLEFRMMAKDSFLKKPMEMIPIPENIREVLFRFNWDKVLVDVRRTITIAPRGKQEVYTAMVAVGNLRGLLGLGLADAASAQDAVAKAHMDSYSNLTYIPLYRGHTIYHRIDHDFHRMKMRLMPRADGWGMRTSDLVSELCGLVGIKNISIKMVGRSKNKFYVAQCLQEALSMQSAPHDGVEGTGVYVREIFSSHSRGRELPAGLKRGVHVL